MSSVALISVYYPWFFPTLVFLIGLCVGSFLNVCIYRMPRGLSIVWPPSFCPKSTEPLRWYENIPLLSFMFLRGRGRASGKPIGWQYPVVELLTACVFVALWLRFPPEAALAYMVMTGIFIAGSFIDWQFKIIPDWLTLGGLAAGLLASALVPVLHLNATPMGSLGSAFWGMMMGSGILLWMAILGELAFRKEAMGFGDVKLLGMIGAFLGWQGAVFSIFAGAVVGLMATLVLLGIEKLSGKNQKFFGREIPFGPMLCTAAMIYLWVRPAVLAHISSLQSLFQT